MPTLNILVACEESQAVTKELRRLGHNAFSCDIMECSGSLPQFHVQGDALKLIDGGVKFQTLDGKFHTAPHKWDLIIAFPPCTYLSNAGACRLYPQKGVLNEERYKKGLEAKAFFMRFYNADCKHIAIENPISSRIYNMPPYSQEIQPYMFGHPYTKKTRLWLKNLPQLTPTNTVEPIAPYVPSGTGRKIKSKYGAAKRGANNADSAKQRAKTFPGIAKAMAEQWTEYINKAR
jgi:hypothetical protein